MKKITFLFCIAMLSSMTAMAQYLSEDFETSVPPAGWLDEPGVTNDTNTDVWIQSTTEFVSGGNSALFNDAGAGDRWLISPVIDLSGATSPELTYFDHVNYSTWAVTHDVMYSTDYVGSGDPSVATWTLINGDIGTEDTWVENGPYALPINATVYIAFHYIGDNSADWYLDDVLVAEAPNCVKPTSLSATVISETSAELSWTESNTPAATNWQYVVQAPDSGEPAAAGTDTATNPVTLTTGLVVGESYEFYVRTDCGSEYSSWEGPFEWTQNVPPANDDCSAAIALTVNEDFNCAAVTSGTVFAATDSGVDTCNGTEDDDVWYSFVATADRHRVSLINIAGNTTDMYHAVYDATVGCGALEDALICNDGNTSNLTDLVIGNTYLVQVYTWTGTPDRDSTFDICIGTPCLADAGTLTADEASVVLAGTATISATANGDMFVPTDYEVTYVLTSGATLIIEQVAATPSFIVNAIGDYTIHTLVAETSDDMDPNYLDLSVIDFGVTTGADVIGLVDAGDLCASLDVTGAPISVNDGSEMDFNNVQWVTDGTNGSDVSLTVGVTTPITVYAKGYEAGVTDAVGQGAGVECWIAINDENTDPSTWDSSMWQVATFEGDSGASDDQYEYTTSTTPVGTHYVAARWRLNNAGFTYAGYNGTWDGTTNVSVELIVEPLANNDCAGAQSITQETEIADTASATATAGTIEGATASGLDAELCAGFTGTANDDVWFSFVALTENVNIDYDLTFDGVAILYSGTCGALTVVECSDLFTNTEEINATGLTVGETYYTRVYQWGTDSTVGLTFDVKIWSPDVSLGVNDFETEAAFTYYPNPVKNTLTLNAQNTIEQVAMYNMLGQEVLRATPNAVDSDLDMSHLQTGTYFVKVTIANVTETIRVIKQ